jgi:tetratricopeptide (TPR) repeat protein
MILGREPFERAVELDPGHTQALSWLGELYALEGRYAEAFDLTGRSLARQSPNWAQVVRAWGVFTFEDSEARDSAVVELSRANDWTVNAAVSFLAAVFGGVPGAMRMAEVLTDPIARPSVESHILGYLHLAHLEVARGRWEAAKAQIDNVSELAPALGLAYQSLLAVTPFLEVQPSELHELRDSLARWDGRFAATPSIDVRGPLSPFGIPDELALNLRTYLSGLLHARLGEGAMALRYAQALEQPAATTDSLGLLHDAALDIRALVAFSHNDPARAITLLEQAQLKASVAEAQASRLYQRSYHRFLRAEALYQLGRDEEALGWFSSFPGPGWGGTIDYTYLAITHLRQGQIYERLGQPHKALEHYTKFIELWSDSEPELQPFVEDAKERSARLAGEPRRR